MIFPWVSSHSALYHTGNNAASVSTRKSKREILQAVAWAGDVEKQLSDTSHTLCPDNKGLWTWWNRDRKQVAEGKMLYTVTHAFDCANRVYALGVLLRSNTFTCVFLKWFLNIGSSFIDASRPWRAFIKNSSIRPSVYAHQTTRG